MAPFRLSCYLLAAAILPASIVAISHPDINIFERQAPACGASSKQCPGLPDGFCCPGSNTCMAVANNTTMVCCASGADCTRIMPIVCDVSQLDVARNPGSSVLTTTLNKALPVCGGSCCPFGFSCTSQGYCRLDSSLNSNPIPITNFTAPACSPSTPSSSAIQPTCNNFPAPAIFAGFFPGMVAGALIAIGTICLIQAHNRRQARLSGSFGKVSASISDPIYQEGSAIRTDFIRKQYSTPSTPTHQPTIQRVRSLFRRSAAATGIGMSTTSSPTAPPPPFRSHRGPPPLTPRLQREPSGESISIFADPTTARDGSSSHGFGRESHQTTFADMMERGRGVHNTGGPPSLPRASPGSYNLMPQGLNISRHG